jgi:hypothetical protein
MPKKSESQKRAPDNKSRCFYSIQSWECRHDKDRSEIKAYVEASGTWETILTVHPTSGASAETMAAYITAIINQQQRKQDLLQDAMDALELVMNDGLTFSSEQAADRVVTLIKKSVL